jgi:hypothetical protein
MENKKKNSEIMEEIYQYYAADIGTGEIHKPYVDDNDKSLNIPSRNMLLSLIDHLDEFLDEYKLTLDLSDKKDRVGYDTLLTLRDCATATCHAIDRTPIKKNNKFVVYYLIACLVLEQITMGNKAKIYLMIATMRCSDNLRFAKVISIVACLAWLVCAIISMIAFGTEINCTAFVCFAITVPIAAVIAGTIIDLITARTVLKLLDKIRDGKEFGD